VSGRRKHPSDGLYVVGVTGGIASGKSTFAKSLAATMPAIVIDADLAGHDVLERPEIARALAGAFGDDVLDARGKVQRGVLGPRAFSTPERLATLNNIVQEPLTDAIDRRMQEHAVQGFTGLLVLDAALLVEWDKGAWCDLVVAVAADPRVRVERLVARTGLSRAEAERRIAAQLPDGARAAYADLVIENQGTFEEFERACQAAAQAIAERARAALAARGRVG
jgi:dephospho-CoA kinase